MPKMTVKTRQNVRSSIPAGGLPASANAGDLLDLVPLSRTNPNKVDPRRSSLPVVVEPIPFQSLFPFETDAMGQRSNLPPGHVVNRDVDPRPHRDDERD